MRNPRRVLSKAQILDRVWSYDFGGRPSIVEIYISYLRKKIDAGAPPDDPHGARRRVPPQAGLVARLIKIPWIEIGAPMGGRRRTMEQMNGSVQSPPEAARQASHREVLVVMSGLMLAMLLAMLDNMIMAPALPTIVGELGGLEHLAWVTTAYILGTAVATPLWGKFGDLFDRKLVFLTAIVVFLVGSGLCGMSRSMTELIFFRALQGVGAGGIMVGVMAVLAVLVPPRERGRYTGYFMAIMPISMVGGPLIGGWITDNASWRWAFYVNLPLGAIALFVVTVTMHLPKNETRQYRPARKLAGRASTGWARV